MNQSEINLIEKQTEQDYPYLKDTGFIYEIKHAINATNKSKATVLRKLHDQNIINELNNDIIQVKNSRGNKKYLFTLNGIRKLVSIIHNFEFEQIKNMSISDMQKLTKFEKNDSIDNFKNVIKEKAGNNWETVHNDFENNIEPIIIDQKEKIAQLKYEIDFMNQDYTHELAIIEQQKKRIADLEKINDLLEEKIDSIFAYQELKKDTNK